MGELPPITVSTFTSKTPKNTSLINHASTSANPDPVISPAFVEANYEVLESLLKESRRQMRNEDLRTELEYYSEEIPMDPKAKGKVIEFKDTPNRDRGRVERESEGRRPSKQRAEGSGNHRVNLPPLLVAHLGRNDNGQPLQSTLTSAYKGHQPSTNSGGNLPPNACSIILGLHEEQRISGFVHGPETRSLVEFLSTYFLTTYKGLMEKTYTWIEAKEVATNGAPNNHREGFDRFNKGSSLDNNKGRKKDRDRFSPYKGSNHGLLANLSKSPREILAIEKVAKGFEPSPRMIGIRQSRDISKYCYFHEDHGHDTNQC
ncbi:hypothetical protein Tco_0562777 [Tanacetum coccineum]